MTTTTVATRSNIDWHERNSRELNRTLTFSFTAHILAAVLIFVLPREWFSTTPPDTKIMTISLAGSTGQKTSGTTPISSKTVEEIAKPNTRPQPPRPVEQKPDPAAALVKTPPPVPAKPAETTKPTPPDVRPPTTGQQVNQGTAKAETGSRSLGEGLMLPGGDGTGGETNLADFCCQEYLTTFSSIIRGNWQKEANGRGITVIRFTIRRDGSITDIEVKESSGTGLLDRSAQRALFNSKLPPLPAAYTNQTLIIRLGFDHGPK